MVSLFYIFVSVKFQIAHLYEVQNKHKAARESYDFILSNRDVSLELKADIYRQLGENLTVYY